jgi:hypothetical protein
MESSSSGTSTLCAEVTNIDRFGVWVIVEDHEYFLPYDDFPWFRNARIAEILNVELAHEGHLHWPDLDVDLCLESLARPEAFPLVYK